MYMYLEGRHSIVANEWVGENEQLVFVGRVCQGLRVAHHSSLKHCSEMLMVYRRREFECFSMVLPISPVVLLRAPNGVPRYSLPSSRIKRAMINRRPSAVTALHVQTDDHFRIQYSRRAHLCACV